MVRNQPQNILLLLVSYLVWTKFQSLSYQSNLNVDITFLSKSGYINTLKPKGKTKYQKFTQNEAVRLVFWQLYRTPNM
jgi:hypothetical protein